MKSKASTKKENDKATNLEGNACGSLIEEMGSLSTFSNALKNNLSRSLIMDNCLSEHNKTVVGVLIKFASRLHTLQISISSLVIISTNCWMLSSRFI